MKLYCVVCRFENYGLFKRTKKKKYYVLAPNERDAEVLILGFIKGNRVPTVEATEVEDAFSVYKRIR